MKNNLPAVRKPVRKRTLALILACLMALALAVPAFAHGCHGGKRTQAQVTVCTVENCEMAGRHVHSGVTYCGYAHAGGVCDGKCLALCPVEDCGIAGRHIHDGVTYCGSHHETGFCAGDCAVSRTGGGHHGGHHHE